MNSMEWFWGKPESFFVISCAFFLGYLVIHLFRHKLSAMQGWLVIGWVLIAIWAGFFTVKRANLGDPFYPMGWF